MKLWSRKLMSLALVIVMLAAMIPAGMITASALDTTASVVTISSVSDWNTVANSGSTFAGQTIQLGANINAGGATLKSLANTFAGTFDGKGYTVSNFKATEALIGINAAGATIQNLTVNGTFTPDANLAGAGMLVSINDGSSLTIRNCTIGGSITAGRAHLGGVVGALVLNDGETATIENLNVTATVKNTRASVTNGWQSAAGVIGVFEPIGRPTLTVRNINMSGQVSASHTGVGGILGTVYGRFAANVTQYAGGTITISNCNVTGTLTSATPNTITGVGGVVGTFGGFKRDSGEWSAYDGELNIDNCVIGGSISNTGIGTNPSSVGGVVGSMSYSHATLNVDHCLIQASFPSNSLTATNGTGAGLILGTVSSQNTSAVNVNNTVTTQENFALIGSAISTEMSQHTVTVAVLNDVNYTRAPSHTIGTSAWKYSGSVTDNSVGTVSSEAASAMVKTQNGFITRVGGQINALAVQDNVADGATLTSSDKYAIRFIAVSQFAGLSNTKMTVIARNTATGKVLHKYNTECTLYDALTAYGDNGAKIDSYYAKDFGAQKFLALIIKDIPGGTAYTFEFYPEYTLSNGKTVEGEVISAKYDANGQYIGGSLDVAPLVEDISVRVMSSNILVADNNPNAQTLTGGLSHEKRIENMANMFLFYEPDFVGLQEVHNTTRVNGYSVINMQTTLMSHVGHKYAFVNFGSQISGTHWTPIMYLKDKWTVKTASYDTTKLCCEMHRWQWALFESIENPECTFILVNIHGPHNGSGHGQAKKEAFYVDLNVQLKALESKYPNTPIAITGDYNENPESQWIAAMTKDTTFRNSCDLTGNKEETPSRIDHVYLTEHEATVTQTRTVCNKVLQQSSDHYAVFADLVVGQVETKPVVPPVTGTPGTAMSWNDGKVIS